MSRSSEPSFNRDPQPHPKSINLASWLSLAAWVIALGTVVMALYLGWQQLSVPTIAAQTQPDSPSLDYPVTPAAPLRNFSIPVIHSQETQTGIAPRPSLYTIIPNRPRQETTQYQVDFGDSVFGIAQKFGIQPETVLWANYAVLNDNPDLLTPGVDLNIPPVDGVYYQWEESDSLESVAAQFKAQVDDIVNWSPNQIDLVNPTVPTGTWIMVPGGQREFRQWLVPTIPRGAAGVSKSLYGPGACEGGYEGAYGSGTFIYPTTNHSLSGNDYWSGHLGIDLAAAPGAGVFAADSGVVVFSGWATGGYGYMVMIDHGNGYQTTYAHLSGVTANCGQSVSQGQVIGSAGSTGNSTGPHLHFEIRFQGGFISPWFVLPSP